MEATEWLGLATLIIGVPLNVVATVLLWKKHQQAPHLRVLKERFIVAALLLVVVIVFGLIFVNNDQEVPWLDDTFTKSVTRAVMLVVAIVPAVAWIHLYRTTHVNKHTPGLRNKDKKKNKGGE